MVAVVADRGDTVGSSGVGGLGFGFRMHHGACCVCAQETVVLDMVAYAAPYLASNCGMALDSYARSGGIGSGGLVFGFRVSIAIIIVVVGGTTGGTPSLC